MAETDAQGLVDSLRSELADARRVQRRMAEAHNDWCGYKFELERAEAALSTAQAQLDAVAGLPTHIEFRPEIGCNAIGYSDAMELVRAALAPQPQSAVACSDGSGRDCDPDCMFPCHSPAQMARIRETGEL